MKKVTFEHVKIQNFLSIGESPIEINFKTGITVITGENKDKGGKNGIGKSTISDAIFWCLFGNTIRELKKDKIQHNKSNGKCEVSLSLTIEDGKGITRYTIKRTLDPAKIEITAHNDQKDVDVTLSTIPKNDEYIKQLIGANEEVFNNAVIMSANNTMPFMAQKKTEKRKFIEGILQMNIFSEMLLKARSLHNDSKKENDLLAKDFVNNQRTLEILNKSKENFDKSKQDRINAIKIKIKSIDDDILKLNGKNIPDVTLVKSEIKKLEDKIEKLHDLLKETNAEIVSIGNETADYLNNLTQFKKEKNKILEKGNTCPTCNRQYCDDDLEQYHSQSRKPI